MSSQEPIGLLVAAIRRRIKQAVGALVEDQSLSPQQFWMLVAVAETEGLALGELARRCRMDSPTASRVIYTLTYRRLVRANVDPQDRRCTRLALTPNGKSLATRLLPIAEKVRGAVDKALTPAERAAVVSGLQKVLSNLEGLEDRERSSAAGARRKPQEQWRAS